MQIVVKVFEGARKSDNSLRGYTNAHVSRNLRKNGKWSASAVARCRRDIYRAARQRHSKGLRGGAIAIPHA